MPSAGRPFGIGARPLSAAALVVLLLVLIAAVLPEGFALSLRAERLTVVIPDLPSVAGYLAVAIAGVLLLTWAVLQLTGMRARGRSGERRAAPLWVQLAIVLLALSLPVLFADELGLRDRQSATQESAERDRPEDPARRADEAPPQRSRALGVVVTLLLGTLLVGLVAGVAWLFWPDKREEPSEDHLATELVLEGLAAGIDDLTLVDDPRRAVMACYARMEVLLAAAGVVRRVSDTPLELLARVLTEQRAARTSVARLTDLFERARFSSHAIDEGMRRSALEALREVQAQVGAPV